MTSRRREGWIDWRRSEAREIILADLKDGTLPVDGVSTQEAWERYRTKPAFANVEYAQFSARLRDHRNQVSLPHSRCQ